MLAVRERRDDLALAIQRSAVNSEYAPITNRLPCLRGISTLTAFSLAVQIGDWTRLGGRTIGSCPGLVSSEHSTGKSRLQGDITRTGSSRPRRLLVEAAWQHKDRKCLLRL